MANLASDFYEEPIVEVVEEVVEIVPEYPAEFITWLESEEERAKDDTLDDERATALKFYNGESFGDEEEGRSQIVTRDVAEVIDYMVPSVLRTMVSGDRVVEFEALDSGFKDVLEEATEAVAQQFMQEQSGWRILHDSLKSGLLEKTGAIKCMVEEVRTRRQEEITASQYAQMGDELEIIEAEPIGALAAMSEEERLLAQQQPPEALDGLGPVLRVTWFETSPRFVDIPLPNEEFAVARDARSLEESIYYRHRIRKSLSELRDMGLDSDLIGLEDSNVASTELTRARDGQRQEVDDYREGPNRQVWLLEEYCRYDLDGDGLAEFLRVQRVGRVILSVEEIDYGTVEEWCPFPMPHRRVGHSLADKVMDIQRTRSVLMRQILDNIYMANRPRIIVPESDIGDSTIDDILTPNLGALIRPKGTGQGLRPLAIPFTAGASLPIMETLVGERESRTGITRLNQGLDADALNKTATGTALMQASGQQIEEYIARNFAEFIGRVFAKKYRLMRDFGRPFQIIVDGEAKTVDPTKWPDEMRVMIRVGLGSGRKEQRIQHRMMLLNLQQQAAGAGDPHVGPKQIYHTVKGLVADLNMGQGRDYYEDPEQMPTPEGPPEPSPELAKVQAQMQIEQAKVQAKLQADQAAHEAEMVKSQAKHQLEQQTAMMKLQMEQARDQAAAQLARDKAQFEADLARAKLDFEQRMAEFRTAADMSRNRPGGSLAE